MRHEDVSTEGKSPLLSQHLEHQVPLVGYGHEFGNAWSAEDGVVDPLEIHDDPVDLVDAEMLWGAELHW